MLAGRVRRPEPRDAVRQAGRDGLRCVRGARHGPSHPHRGRELCSLLRGAEEERGHTLCIVLYCIVLYCIVLYCIVSIKYSAPPAFQP